MRIPDECVTESSGQRVTAKENKKTFAVLNPSGKVIRKVKVDGCVITDASTIRCDYLFEIGTPLDAVLYVELKGKNIEHACEQLSSTLKLFSRRHGRVRRHCYVVAARVPGTSTRNQVLQRKFFRDNKVHVRFKSLQLEERV